MTPLVLQCARPCPDSDTVSGLASNETDWEPVLAEADRHSLAPLLAWTLKRVCPGAVPPAILSHLERRLRAAADRNLAFTAELFKTLALFDRAGIPVIPFKGPALAWSLYESPALREMTDLDLLVRPADAQRAVDLLVASGCLPRYGVDLRFFRSGRELPLTSSAGVALDLHWALAPSQFCHGLDLDLFWSRLATISIAARPVRTLAPEDLLVFLCVHGAKHAWSSLHWLADIARLIDRVEIDWDRLIAGVHARRISRMVLAGLLLAVDVLGAGVPAAIVVKARSHDAAAALAERIRLRLLADVAVPAAQYEDLAYQFRLLERPADKLRFCWGQLAPAPADYESLRLPARLFSLYYAFRPLRLVAKHSGLAAGRQIA
jgi:hypothetical protein